MEEKNVQQVLNALKRFYPELDVSILPTKQCDGRWLVVVKGFADEGDIDFWSIQIIYPIWWTMVDILKDFKDGLSQFRLLFVRGNQFLLHSPDVGRGDVFREMKKGLCKDTYGHESLRHYVGQSIDINDVLTYLTETEVWF
jgi:hypothetical protein